MAISASLLARRTHKWLALFVGVQALIWTLTGLYMTVVHIDIIHGDHFIRQAKPRAIDPARLVDPLAAARAAPGAEGARLHWLLDRPTYIVWAKGGASLVDAVTGERLPPPSAAQIRQLADHWFTGDEKLVKVSLIARIPGEIRGRKPPLWRADFDGWNKPTLYFSPQTGELVSRRHELWRVFDFVWMLHIMDYETRDNVNNPVLRVFTWGAVLMALSGAWLLVYSFPRRRRSERRP
ncbi:MAG: hypothetical protein WBR13_06880 [Allosphingosinicella sp.]